MMILCAGNCPPCGFHSKSKSLPPAFKSPCEPVAYRSVFTFVSQIIEFFTYLSLSLLHGSSTCSVNTLVHGGSVEPLSRVLLLLLVDHDADDEAAYAAEHAEEEKEEELEAGHRRRLGVVNVVWNRMNMLMLVRMKHNSMIHLVC